MSNFIRLTSANGNPVFVNMDVMEAFGTITEKTYDGASDYVGMTYIVPCGMVEDQATYVVKETLGEVWGKVIIK